MGGALAGSHDRDRPGVVIPGAGYGKAPKRLRGVRWRILSGMTSRESLHGLVDELPDSLLAQADLLLRSFVKTECDPVQRALDEAPLDDEPLTPEERDSIDRGWRSMVSGRNIDESALAKLLDA